LSLNFDKIKSLNQDEIENYGNKNIKALCQFYITKELFKNNEFSHSSDDYVLKEIGALEEYQVLKKLIVNEYKTTKTQDIDWKVLKSSSFTNISKLIKISPVIPLSSVECERSFSKMNIIKTKLRNCLDEDTLDNLMLLSLCGENIENLDFVKPIENWKLGKKRYFFDFRLIVRNFIFLNL